MPQLREALKISPAIFTACAYDLEDLRVRQVIDEELNFKGQRSWRKAVGNVFAWATFGAAALGVTGALLVEHPNVDRDVTIGALAGFVVGAAIESHDLSTTIEERLLEHGIVPSL